MNEIQKLFQYLLMILTKSARTKATDTLDQSEIVCNINTELLLFFPKFSYGKFLLNCFGLTQKLCNAKIFEH